MGKFFAGLGVIGFIALVTFILISAKLVFVFRF